LHLALALVAVLGLALAWTTYGANDVLFFKSYAYKADVNGARQLYADGYANPHFSPRGRSRGGRAWSRADGALFAPAGPILTTEPAKRLLGADRL